MKIYTFWSADTTYFTTSKSLKKAQVIGKDNMKNYFDTCEYLGDQPETGLETYFIPQSIEEIEVNWFKYMFKTNPDIMLLDDKLYEIVK